MAAAAFVAAPSPTPSASTDCPSGYFCAWNGVGYTGTIRKTATVDAYVQLNLSQVESYYNNRSKRTWIHATSDGSGTYECIAAGVKSSNVSGWKTSAKAVWLSTTTAC